MVISCAPLQWSSLGNPSNDHLLRTLQMVISWSPLKWSSLGHPQMVTSRTPLKWSSLGHPSNGHLLGTPQMVSSWAPLKWSSLGNPSNGHLLGTLQIGIFWWWLFPRLLVFWGRFGDSFLACAFIFLSGDQFAHTSSTCYLSAFCKWLSLGCWVRGFEPVSHEGLYQG